MKFSKAKSIFQKFKWDIFACIVIAIIIIAIGFRINAWTGALKGDDAYLHAGMVQYVLDSFPHLDWLHQFHNGYPPLQFAEVTFYMLFAFLHLITGLTIVSLLQMSLCFSMIFIGISTYVLARVIKIPRLLAIGFSLILFSMSNMWNQSIIGGGYNRVLAFPFAFLSLTLTYIYAKNVNSHIKDIKNYIAVVSVFTILAFLHPLIWQWTFLFILGILGVGINGWRNKLLNVFKTILPVAGLAAWLYIPLLHSYGSSVTNDTASMLFKWLVYVPSRKVWSIDLGMLILPLALLGLIIAGINYKRISINSSAVKLELKIVALFSVFCPYYFAYGWLHMPKYTYLMAAYDYCLWFGISLVILSIFTYSILYQAGIFLNAWKYFIIFLEFTFVPIAVLACVLTVPFLQGFTQADNPDDFHSLSYNIKQIVEHANKNSGSGYRLFNNQRILTRWL